MGAGGTSNNGVPATYASTSNEGRVSAFVAMLPFLDQTALWNEISNPHGEEFTGGASTTSTTLAPKTPAWPPGGGRVWDNAYPPWRTQVASLLCPSDGAPNAERPMGDSNYAVNWGDNGGGVYEDNSGRLNQVRGMFRRNGNFGLQDARDGTVNTVLFGEIGRPSGDRAYQGSVLEGLTGLTFDEAIGYTSPIQCVDQAANPANPGRYPNTLPSGNLADRGAKWNDGGGHSTGFTTILPPNGPSCASNTNDQSDALLSAGSYHAGGVQIVLCDGSVRFISDTIDTGNLTAAPTNGKSPYGVWGALGSRAGGETKTEF